MTRGLIWTLRYVAYRLAAPARRPELLAFLPAVTLGSFWLGGEGLLLITALTVPLLYALAGILAPLPMPAHAARPARDPVTGLTGRDGALAALDDALALRRSEGLTTACIVVRLDDPDRLAERHGREAEVQVLRRTGERLRGALRERDTVARLEGATFAIALCAVARADLEGLLQISARLQEAVAVPVSVDAATLHVSASVGFCLLSQSREETAAALLDAAEAAAIEARRNGPAAIRAFTREMQTEQSSRDSLRGEIEAALDNGAIRAFFQPQISTDTGEISGVETLVRWEHPERGLLVPADFLPELHAAGLSDRLGEVMLFHALSALRAWDRTGLALPGIAINLSQEELRNPRLAEKIRWELDRFDIVPARLTVEVLETVVAQTDNDVVLRNIRSLAADGCGIDLDDFGTGHAAIGNIRRFAVTRVKIDRSFVTRVDTDREQQRIVAAILSMAEQLDLKTIGEGVETLGEHAMLSQLGCSHVQGFSIARPMPFEDLAVWAERHRTKLSRAPQVRSKPA